MDKIHIVGLEIDVLIGTLPQERTAKQPLVFDLHLGGDFAKAGKTDTLTDTVNYRDVEEKLIAMVENSSFLLLEALAETAAQLCLSVPGVRTVNIRITKPRAALRNESISVEIDRP
mgnify:CR=1 FL=1